MKKNRRLKQILIFLALLLIGFGVWFFFILDDSGRDQVTTDINDLFPFGEVQPGSPVNQETPIQITETGETPVQVTEAGDDFVGPRLRQISQFPTVGIQALTNTTQETVLTTSADEEGTTIQEEVVVSLRDQKVRYARIQDGSVYETVVTPQSLNQEMLVETFVPNAQRVSFSKEGNHVTYQYWNTDDHTSETYIATIAEPPLDVEPCPYFFDNPIEVGENSSQVLSLHTFLNQFPQTRIAINGINSPGNESSIANEQTLTAIKNFQSLHGLKIDGLLGEDTRIKMLEVCDERQRMLAEQVRSRTREDFEVTGYFLPQGVIDVDINPEEQEFFYLEEDAVGVSGYVRSFEDASRIKVFESEFSEWTANWDAPRLNLYTKPSYLAEGFSYELSPATGDYFKVVTEDLGLMTKPSTDNGKYLFSKIGGQAVQTGVFNTETNRSTFLRIKTFPEKCVWEDETVVYCAVPNTMNNDGEYPDTWYLGLELFSDSLWRIDTENLQETLVSNLQSEYRESIDVTDIVLSDDEEYLYFINKHDETLWSYRLADV